ncbi:MAG: hypothetical protein LAP21_19235 [Acidobacteriia bacterium]|nr:hypothetical protein [Terriglobia bacterium]
MSRRFLSSSEVAIAVGALIVSIILLFVHHSNPLSDPVDSVRFAVAGASHGNLDQLKAASTDAYHQDLIGHFGEGRFHQVRNVYQEAYNRAMPAWLEYRRKAETLARGAYDELQDKVQRAGKETLNSLSVEERLKLTEDREKYEERIFEEGVKSLGPQDREKVGDPQAFRKRANFRSFVDRYAWASLSESDRSTLGSAAVLASGITPEKVAFLESTGLPMLKPEERQIVSGISSSELANPTSFMLRYGVEPAKKFLAEAAISPTVQIKDCKVGEEERQGSLFKGSLADCTGTVSIRSNSHELAIRLRRTGGNWKVASVTPDIYQFRDAYPPRSVRESHSAGITPPPAFTPVAPEENERIETPGIPNASWQHVTEVQEAESEVREGMFTLLFKVLLRVIGPVLLFLILVSTVAVMTANYRRKLDKDEQPALLEGEREIRTVSVRNFLVKSTTTLTDLRVIQARNAWWLSRRTAAPAPLADLQAVLWRRFLNWPLLLLAVVLIGRCNPAALLLAMLALEAKIYAVQFKRSFFHLPFSGIWVWSMRRAQFSELWGLFQLSQLGWQGVRMGRQPTEPARYPDVGPERDFQFGKLVWAAVLTTVLVAFLQRVTGGHVTLYAGILGPVMLAMPMVAGIRGVRSGLLAAVFSVAAIVCMKFPEFSLLPGLSVGGDGGGANPLQYFVVMVVFLLVGLASALLSRFSTNFAPGALLLWILYAALFRSQDIKDFSFYAHLSLATVAGMIVLGVYTWFFEKSEPGEKPGIAAAGMQ